MKSEWEKECERFLFDYGRLVLGKDSGGIIVRLKQAYGISQAWNQLKAASTKSDPREYIGAILRGKKFDENSAKVGEIHGRYMWDGYKWKELERNDPRVMAAAAANQAPAQ